MQTETISKKPQSLSFWTNGECFTNLLRDFYQSGEYSKVIDILKDGGCTNKHIKQFFMGELRFAGDTRTEEGMWVENETEEIDGKEMMFVSYRTYMNNKKIKNRYYEYHLKEILNDEDRPNEFQLLLEFFTFEEIRDALYLRILKDKGYEPANFLEKVTNGVILQNGVFIACDYMEHNHLYGILHQLKLASSSQWYQDNKTLHISSSSVSGSVSGSIEHYGLYDDAVPTEEQLDTLFKYRYDITQGFYGYGNNQISEVLINYINDKFNKGGKFNNLTFLKRFYGEINVPNFSLSPLDIKGNKLFIRTSPKKSLPGLLNSRLVDDNQHQIDEAIREINEEFSKHLGLLKVDYVGGKKFDDNEIHWFFQEFLEGANGVAHYYEKEFKYQVSTNQGDIVKGIQSNQSLDPRHYDELRKICSLLSNDMKQPIQVEFVIHKDKVFIVQLRILENHYDKTVQMNPPSNIIVNGETFSKGNEEVDVKDILIVESDGASELLIGKKALIVESNVEFSHLLALSKALRIPSMFNTGKVNFQGAEKVKFTAYNREAWVSEIKY